MKRLPPLLGYGLLAGSLAACDNNPVEVSFAQPFPTAGADQAGFLPRDQGRYAAAVDTASTLVVSRQQIVRQVVLTVKMRAAELDSMGLPRRAGPARGHEGELYHVFGLTPDSCRLRWAVRDTLVQLTGANATHLRRYRGWYYLSTPADSGRWQVERLAVAGGQLHWQEFNRDSLRIRALQPSIVRLKRVESRLLFTLTPRPGRATRQVDKYAGLWLTKGEYLRKE
jgi:hypothetical protein